MMFPKQFLQLASEAKIATVYKGLVQLGVLMNEHNQSKKADDKEALWFDENTAIKSTIRNALDNPGDEYDFSDFGWTLATYFEQQHG